jgi:hypothetical protein
MSVLSVKNIQETFIGKAISRTASLQITSPDAASYIADGEVAVLNSTGVPMTTATTNTYAASPYIQIVQRNGNNLVFSSKVYGNKVTSYAGRAASVGQEQVYAIGYNGSTGSLDITAGLDYQLTLIENQDDMMWAEQKKKNVTLVTNNLVTSQQDLAKAIVRNIMKKYSIDGLSVTAAMLNNGGTVAAFTTATTANVTHGSNVVVWTTASPANATFGAGAVIRLGATGSGRGVTVPAYTVQGPHPTITFGWILDQPYAGPTNALLPAADQGLVTAVGSSWGVRFTGKYLTSYRRDFFKFKRTAFTLQMSGFGATVITKTSATAGVAQDMAYGYGDGRLVLEEESFSKGFEGALNRMSVPLPIANETFTTDGTYTSTININFADAFINATTYYNAISFEFFSINPGTVVNSAPMPQLIKIFMHGGADGTTKAAQGATDASSGLNTKAVQTALNTWMFSVPGAFANSSAF